MIKGWSHGPGHGHTVNSEPLTLNQSLEHVRSTAHGYGSTKQESDNVGNDL